jgi:lipopolysaccharide export system permease protein
MPIIYKYILKEMLKYFAIVMGAVVGIYLAVDFFEKIDSFIEADVPFSKAAFFFAFKVPLIISQIIPVCVLLSVLIIFCLMVKNNEIIALKSSGVGMYYMVRPVIALGFLFTLVLFFLSEVIVPVTVEKSNSIWLQDVKKKKAVVSQKKNIWIKGVNSIIHMDYYDPEKKTIFGITINRFDKEFRLIKRTDAKQAVYTEKTWVLFDIIDQNLTWGKEKTSVVFIDKREENLGFLPDDLQGVVKKSEEMSFNELSQYIQKIEAEGYDAGKYKIDLYAKIAFPFVCLIMSMVGSGIALKGTFGGSMPVKICIGIGLAFTYWIFYSFCVSLGYGQMLPPLISVWTANMVFFCLGGYFLFSSS